jgi:hypothetical protein
MVLTKEAYTEAIGQREQRIINEKINFLRDLQVFSKLTRITLTNVFFKMEKIRVNRR